MDAGNQRQAAEVWSPELDLLVTWTKARAEKAAWRKRLLWICAWFPLSYGPSPAGSVHWLWEKRALGLPNHCATSCHVPNQRLLITLCLVTRADKLWWASLDWTTLTPHPDWTAQPHRPEGFPLTHSPTCFWFTLLFSGDAGVCWAAEEALRLNAIAWHSS